MKYKQDYCPPGDYFKCADTLVADEVPESVQEVTPSQELPLDTGSYQSTKEPHKKSVSEGLRTLAFDTSGYKKSSVRKITYRVTKK